MTMRPLTQQEELERSQSLIGGRPWSDPRLAVPSIRQPAQPRTGQDPTTPRPPFRDPNDPVGQDPGGPKGPIDGGKGTGDHGENQGTGGKNETGTQTNSGTSTTTSTTGGAASGTGYGGNSQVNVNLGRGGPDAAERERLRREAEGNVNRTVGATPDATNASQLNRQMRFTAVTPQQGQAQQVNQQLQNTLNRALSGLPGYRQVGAGSGQLSGQFGQAEQDLTQARVGEFSPVNPADFSGARGLYGQAQTRTQGVGPVRVPGVSQTTGQFNYDQDTLDARGVAGQLAGELGSGPDRFELAARALARRREEQAPVTQNLIRQIGQSAAAFGRIGSGTTTSRLGDLGLELAADDRRFEESVLDRALEGTIGDRRADLGAATGASESLAGLDLGRSGFGADVGFRNADLGMRVSDQLGDLGDRSTALAQTEFTNEQGERDRGLDVASQNAALALSRSQQRQNIGHTALDEGYRARAEGRQERDTEFAQGGAQQQALLQALSSGQGLSSLLYGQDAAMRGEQREERGYANDLDQQALQNAINQALLEEQFKDSGFQRALDKARLLASIAGIGTGDDLVLGATR